MLNINRRFTLPYISHIIRKIATTSHRASEDLFVHRDSNDNNPNTHFEFTEANMTRIRALMLNYPKGAQRSALGAVLDIAQRQAGWLPISAMHKAAEILNVPRMRVYEMATFYTMFKRKYRGKYNVKVCVTTPCWLRGSDCILQAVEEACCCCAGSVSPDGMFGVDTVQCQGACANAPILVVDDDYYEDVDIYIAYYIIECIRNGSIPRCGPQNGRFAAEPVTGLTSLWCCPPQPGFGIQPALLSPGSK